MNKIMYLLLCLSILLISACDNRDTESNDSFHDSLILLQGGSFTMGSIEGENSEQPLHQVTLSPFAISKYEVTQADWMSVMDSLPAYFTNSTSLPVEQVSWYAAIVYCNRLSVKKGLTPCYKKNGTTNTDNWGAIPETDYATEWDSISCNWSAGGYRLPTEAEWEYAAKGGTLSTNTLFSGANLLNDVGWYEMNSTSRTQVVGLKNANQISLYDMSGNVWEWCWDQYGSYSALPQIDPHGHTSNSDRVIRGGSWESSANNCRNTKRNFIAPGYFYSTIGFRVVRTYKP